MMENINLTNSAKYCCNRSYTIRFLKISMHYSSECIEHYIVFLVLVRLHHSRKDLLYERIMQIAHAQSIVVSFRHFFKSRYPFLLIFEIYINPINTFHVILMLSLCLFFRLILYENKQSRPVEIQNDFNANEIQ